MNKSILNSRYFLPKIVILFNLIVFGIKHRLCDDEDNKKLMVSGRRLVLEFPFSSKRRSTYVKSRKIANVTKNI